MNKHKLFEEFLKDQWTANTQGLSFEEWFGKQDAVEMYQFAEKFGEDLQFAHAVELANKTN